MADPVVAQPVVESPAAAPAAAATAAPATANPAPAEAQASPAASTPAAPAAEGDAAASPAAVPESIPSLLEEFDKAKAEKEAAAKVEAAKVEGEAKKPDAKAETKPGEAKPEDKKPDAAPAVVEPMVYEYKLPETLKIDEPQKLALNAALDSFRADPKAGVQALIDLHAKTMTDFAAATLQRQYDVFNQTRRDWQKQVMSDPILGGSGYETAMAAVARMRDRYVPESKRARFNEFLRVTGAGDHPAFLDLLHSVARDFDEPKPPPANPKPPPDNGRAPGRRSLRTIYKDSAG